MSSPLARPAGRASQARGEPGPSSQARRVNARPIPSRPGKTRPNASPARQPAQPMTMLTWPGPPRVKRF